VAASKEKTTKQRKNTSRRRRDDYSPHQNSRSSSLVSSLVVVVVVVLAATTKMSPKKILFREDEEDDDERYRGREEENDDDASLLSMFLSLGRSPRAQRERERESALSSSSSSFPRRIGKEVETFFLQFSKRYLHIIYLCARSSHTHKRDRENNAREFDDDDMIASSSRCPIAVYPTTKAATPRVQFREKKQPSIGRERHLSSSSSSLSLRARKRGNFAAVAAASNNDGNDEDVYSSSSSSLAPSTPTSPHGEMLEYILSTEPSSFEGAIDSVLEKLSDEIDASSKKAAKSDDNNNNNGGGEEKKDSMSLTLYKRIEDIKRMDRRRAVEDAMYASIIHKVS